MNWLSFSLFCVLLPYSLEAYPLQAQAPAKLGDPADYPDLTNGLSNAEIEATLNDLSLDDLSSLDKLLDENGNEVGYSKARPGVKRHRQIKAPRAQNFDFDVDPVDDASLDDDEDKEKESPKCRDPPRCTKKSTCPTTTTCPTTAPPCTTTCSTTCPTTESCTTKCIDSSKRKLGGFLDDDFDMDMAKCSEKSKSKTRKPKKKYEDVCDVDDAECLQRNLDRLKHQKNSFQDYNMDEIPPAESAPSLDYDLGGNNLDGDMLQPDVGPLKPKKELNGWNDRNELSRNMFNIEPTNMQANWNPNDYKSASKMSQNWNQRNADPEEEQPSKVADEIMPYERQQMAKITHENGKVEIEPSEAEDSSIEQEKEEDIPSDEQPQEKGARDESELTANKEQACNNGDSFIAQNARDPPRYLIQTQSGEYIQSDNDPKDQLMYADQNQSQMMNLHKYELSEGIQSEFKRNKRENKKLDDAPENADESYLKKLMDSFPRDQSSQSNINIALKETERAHFRVKRS